MMILFNASISGVAAAGGLLTYYHWLPIDWMVPLTAVLTLGFGLVFAAMLIRYEDLVEDEDPPTPLVNGRLIPWYKDGKVTYIKTKRKG